MKERIDPRTIMFNKWPVAFEGLTEEQCERVMAWHEEQTAREDAEHNKRYWRMNYTWIAICAVIIVLACI